MDGCTLLYICNSICNSICNVTRLPRYVSFVTQYALLADGR